MGGTMRAARLVTPGTIAIHEIPRPEPAAGEVRLKLEGCGVCASNLEPWAGLPWLTYPAGFGALGHEPWGIVEGVGSEVAGLKEGDRVTGLSFNAFAEYDVARADNLIKIPAQLANQPLPGEPLGCALNIFRRSRIEPGQTVAIIGIGFLGAVLTRLAARAGAHVLAISRRAESLSRAQALGARETIAMDDHWRIIETVRDLTGGRMCERVIEAVGKQWPLDLAGALVGTGGTLVVAGYHQDGPRQVNMQDWNWKGIDVVNAHERHTKVVLNGIEQAMARMLEGELDPLPLYTHRFPLDRLADALDATRDKPGDFVKALITYD